MDQKLFFSINQAWTSHWLDWLMAVLSSFDFWAVPLCVFIALGLYFGGFRFRAAILVAALAVGVTDGLVVNTLKKAVNRPRPHQVEAARVVGLRKTRPRFLGVFHAPKVKTSKPEKGPITGRSFPSGHTSDNFAVAAVLALFFRRWGWLYFPAGAAIGYSRIYTGSHWPSDVFFSSLLGIACGALVALLAQRLWSRWGGRVAPRLKERHPHLWQPSLKAPQA